LALVSHWLEKLGLTIHPTKTRLCHARKEPFDFLGYTLARTVSPAQPPLADTAIRSHVIERVRRFLCRRHKLRVSGTHRFGYAEVFGKVG
jgi:hypothetical protein